MKYTFNQHVRLSRHDLGVIFDGDNKLGTALYTYSDTKRNCSLNRGDFESAFLMKIEFVLFENYRHEQHVHTFENAIKLFKAGEHKVGKDGDKYVVISWFDIIRDPNRKQEEIPF